MLKVTVAFEIEEEDLKEIFESYDIKFTKKKVIELKKDIKENEYDFAYELDDDFRNFLGNIINDLFGE